MLYQLSYLARGAAPTLTRPGFFFRHRNKKPPGCGGSDRL
jgi:hypothetical protein